MHVIYVSMKLEVMKKCCSLYRLDENREIPGDIYKSEFFSVTKTDKELSIICDSDINLSCCIKIEQLILLRVVDTVDFEMTGVISSISECLTKNGIPIFAESTSDTVYIIVRKSFFTETLKALSSYGFEVSTNI